MRSNDTGTKYLRRSSSEDLEWFVRDGEDQVFNVRIEVKGDTAEAPNSGSVWCVGPKPFPVPGVVAGDDAIFGNTDNNGVVRRDVYPIVIEDAGCSINPFDSGIDRIGQC